MYKKKTPKIFELAVSQLAAHLLPNYPSYFTLTAAHTTICNLRTVSPTW